MATALTGDVAALPCSERYALLATKLENRTYDMRWGKNATRAHAINRIATSRAVDWHRSAPRHARGHEWSPTPRARHLVLTLTVRYNASLAHMHARANH